MIGDALSDAYAGLVEAINGPYADERDRLPVELRIRLAATLEQLNRVREQIDAYQIR